MKLSASEGIEPLIARYAAGTLPLPAHVLIQSHLAIRNEHRALATGLEMLGGRMIEDCEPIALSRPDMLELVLDSSPPFAPVLRGERPGSIFPGALRELIAMDVDEIPWRTRMPGFREHELGEVDGMHATLFWIRPGRRIPAHTHTGVELTLVLDGAFSDSRGRFSRGDISVADDSVDHRPVADADRPCISFAVTEGKLKLTGRLHQRLGDILGT